MLPWLYPGPRVFGYGRSIISNHRSQVIVIPMSWISWHLARSRGDRSPPMGSRYSGAIKWTPASTCRVTAAATVPAECTTPVTISTTMPCRWAPHCGRA
jgi:hypothetical protein